MWAGPSIFISFPFVVFLLDDLIQLYKHELFYFICASKTYNLLFREASCQNCYTWESIVDFQYLLFYLSLWWSMSCVLVTINSMATMIMKFSKIDCLNLQWHTSSSFHKWRAAIIIKCMELTWLAWTSRGIPFYRSSNRFLMLKLPWLVWTCIEITIAMGLYEDLSNR